MQDSALAFTEFHLINFIPSLQFNKIILNPNPIQVATIYSAMLPKTISNSNTGCPILRDAVKGISFWDKNNA